MTIAELKFSDFLNSLDVDLEVESILTGPEVMKESARYRGTIYNLIIEDEVAIVDIKRHDGEHGTGKDMTWATEVNRHNYMHVDIKHKDWDE